MLVGAAMGAQVGSVATKYIKGYGIRTAFGVAVIGCAASIVLKIIPTYAPSTKVFCDTVSTWMVLGVVSSLSVYIFVKMLQGAKREVAMKKASVARQAA
jgi:heme/copper-type cytochrome/quinol oxidase subunit 4